MRLKRQADPSQINEMAREVMAPTLWKGKLAPNFELTRTDGSKFVLADHIGKEVVILNFFATWCGPCRAETPELNRFYAESRDKPGVSPGVSPPTRQDSQHSLVTRRRDARRASRRDASAPTVG